MVLECLSKVNIKCNNDLYVALNNMRDSLEQAAVFVKKFKDISRGFNLCHKEESFNRCASMYMDKRWEYDNGYFWQTIERYMRMNTTVVGCIITKMSELNKDGSFSNDDSILDLQVRARENSSSNNDTDSFGDDEIYNDGEYWGYKTQTLNQIIGEKSNGMFPNIIPTLYAFSWYGYAKISANPVIRNEDPDFHQARD